MAGAAGTIFSVLIVGSLPSANIVSVVRLHGQKYSAAIVIVVSRQLENVLVEQNHCHGLNTVMTSCSSNQLWTISVAVDQPTAAHAVLLPVPYILSDNCQV